MRINRHPKTAFLMNLFSRLTPRGLLIWRSLLVRVALSVAMALFVATVGAAAEAPVDYSRDIRPILSQNCFFCHGFNEKSREAELRLDKAESALADRDGTPAIVAGKPDGSEAWRRITESDESERMPPPDSHRALSAEQKALIRRWILEGAKYASHWSFTAPTKATPPPVRNERWPHNEIDRFILAKLDAEKLQPLRRADRYTLIRRLSFDLTGLPPSASEVEAFVADRAPDAYERLVDRLLASPRFGERMALDWLDAARYADTNGYSIDGGRHLWLWRDWVIHAFNRNMPYDAFLREQLAGDLMESPSESQLIATGFQRNNMVTHEGGTIPEENLVNYNADRVKTLGEAVLGLTLGCAQCHDHKYDPVSQREYYQLFAFFNTLSDVGLDGRSGKNARPTYMTRTVLPSDEEIPALKRRIAALRKKLSEPEPQAVRRWELAQHPELERRGADLELSPVALLKISTPNSGSGFEIAEDGSAVFTNVPSMAAYDISMRLPGTERPITGLRIVFHPKRQDGDDWGYGKLEVPAPRDEAKQVSESEEVSDSKQESESKEKNESNQGQKKAEAIAKKKIDEKKTAEKMFLLTAVSASVGTTPGDQVNLSELLSIARVTANSWYEAFRPEQALDTRNHNGWSPDKSSRGPVHVTISFDQPFAADNPFATVQLNFGHGQKLLPRRVTIFALTGEDDDSTLPPDLIAILKTPVDKRTRDQTERVKAYYSAHAPDTERTRIELANLEERLATRTEKFSTMIMDEAKKPRATFVLTRGNYAQPGEKAPPGVPAALPTLPEGAPLNRLGLAEWVTMSNHPLTARVAVNRLWRIFFGAGLVRTPADFGSQGAWPTHRELLDWMAVDFVESGWDTKALVRKIVMSSTYRQDSATSEELLVRDPQNLLLARGPRFRLSAEFIRDAALKTGGLLTPWIGGPSVNPYTPGDLWREVSHYGSSPESAQTFVQDHGAKLYRRSMYTYWKRTVPPPNLAAFDAPNRETCVVQRPSTTTPLQALVTLNDVQFVEAARALAERMIKHGEEDGERLRWAFLECVSRPPSAEELQVLTAALARERKRYADDPEAARRFLSVGESPRDESLAVDEHAAWSQVALLLLNLSESMTRN